MRVLVLHSHPPMKASAGRFTSSPVRAGKGRPEVDGCNLYEEGFDPVLSAHDRRVYHDIPDNLCWYNPMSTA